MSGARDRAASVAQYVLLGGFAAVASGISSQGLTGFARANMALSGPWPYLLFFALDGAAGVCAVLLARRAARSQAGTAPRVAVWGLVAASATFNYAHAPRRPEAPEAYALMPVVAAVLFEFCLQETRSRASRPGRRLGAARWLRPAERVRVRLRMAADDALPAGEATRLVRVESAARSLYRLREALAARERAGASSSRRARRALRRAHAALARAGFADAAVAAEVLRHVQVLTMTTTLAALDYASAGAAHAAIGNLITPGAVPDAGQQELPAFRAGPADTGTQGTAPPQDEASASQGPGPDTTTGTAQDAAPEANDPESTASAEDIAESPAESLVGRDDQLVEAARRIAADAAREGARLSQAALAERLRGQGWTIANDRLSWLAATIGLGHRRG